MLLFSVRIKCPLENTHISSFIYLSAWLLRNFTLYLKYFVFISTSCILSCCSSLLLQLGVLPVSRLPWLPVHHGVRSPRRRVQTLQGVGLPRSVLPGAVAASDPAVRPAAASPSLPLFTSSSSFFLPPFTLSFQHLQML